MCSSDLAGAQTLGGSFLPEEKRQWIEINRVLQKDRPIGSDREIVQKGKPLEAVAAIAQELARPRALGGEFHQPHSATGARFDAKGHHPWFAVVPRIEAGMGAEGLTGLEGAIQEAEAAGVEGVWIEGMGGTGFPKRQQLVAKAHHMGVGDVFQAHIQKVGEEIGRAHV